MSPSRNKFVLLLLLALLQCFAPLLHAHTHGSSVADGLHIDGVGELLAADSSKPAFMAERVEDPAITMAQEYRKDSVIALPDVDQSVLPAPVLSSVSIRVPFQAASIVTSFPGGSLLHSRPFSQAPPHLI